MKQALSIVIFVFIFLSGCAVTASGPIFVEAKPPQDNKALVYIFRENKDAGGGFSTAIRFNSRRTVEVLNGGYMYTYLPAGEYEVQVLGTIVSRNYNFEPGQTYYFENTATYWESHAYYGTRFELEPIGAKVGSQKILETRLISDNFFAGKQ